MCYTGKFFTSKKPRIAKKDIKVFKYAFNDGGLIRPYFMKGRPYEEGKEYQSEITWFINCFNELCIEKGLHSFNKRWCWSTYDDTYIIIHSLLFKSDILFYVLVPLVKMECHIPKGATYYINLSGEMVSDKLVVDKIKYLKNDKVHNLFRW